MVVVMDSGSHGLLVPCVQVLVLGSGAGCTEVEYTTSPTEVRAPRVRICMAPRHARRRTCAQWGTHFVCCLMRLAAGAYCTVLQSQLQRGEHVRRLRLVLMR